MRPPSARPCRPPPRSLTCAVKGHRHRGKHRHRLGEGRKARTRARPPAASSAWRASRWAPQLLCVFVAAAAQQQDSDRAGLIVEGDELVLNLMAPSRRIGAVVLSLVGVGRDQLQHAELPAREPREIACGHCRVVRSASRSSPALTRRRCRSCRASCRSSPRVRGREAQACTALACRRRRGRRRHGASGKASAERPPGYATKKPVFRHVEARLHAHRGDN